MKHTNETRAFFKALSQVRPSEEWRNRMKCLRHVIDRGLINKYHEYLVNEVDRELWYDDPEVMLNDLFNNSYIKSEDMLANGIFQRAKRLAYARKTCVDCTDIYDLMAYQYGKSWSGKDLKQEELTTYIKFKEHGDRF